MNVFDLDRALITDYEGFARSFTQIRAFDILKQVEAIYASDRFWPQPLITINPHFERGASIGELVQSGSLHPETANVFRVDGQSITLLRAELDAWYARAYGLTRDELRYILDPTDVMGPTYPSETFRVLKTNELRRHGEYRTARLVLAAWDALERGQTLRV